MKFCFANWISIVKENAIEKSPSNQDLVSDLFFYIREFSHSMPKSGQTSWVSKEIVSALFNRKESLPKDIKNGLVKSDFEKLYQSIRPFFSKHLNDVEVSSAVYQVLESYRNSKSCNYKTLSRIETMIGKSETKALALLLVETAKIENKLFGIKRSVYANGNNAINYIYGDIIAMSLPQKKRGKRAIYVIPVDADFHFHVTQSGEHPSCVSANTVHGKWIKRLETFGVNECQIINSIGGYSGGMIGDIRTFEFKDSLFYLLACSKFDENNVAHSSKTDIEYAIEKLLQYHDSFGQGDELYIPLIGTGSSRAKLRLKESFAMIRDKVLENQQWHNGHITIVLHINAIEKMEEFEDVLQD